MIVNLQSKGIVISNRSDLFIVEDIETNRIINCRARGKFKEQGTSPLVGDFVVYEFNEGLSDEGIVVKICDRKNNIKRPKMANLSQIIFVVSMKLPKPDLLLLDKQLAFAELNAINPIIALNKIDLVNKSEVYKIKEIYSSIGYTVIETVACKQEGVYNLLKILQNNITAFSGNSGVGKSTLINGIFKDSSITSEGNISEKNKRGKNTTTNIFLYKIDKNSYIADTPGFSSFDIIEIESKDLFKYFVEFKEYEKDCKFVGCTHLKEQDCGIKRAYENGKIPKTRYENFCKIYIDLKERENRRW